MADDLQQAQQDFIEAFGNLYAAYGWKRLDGLILGLLLARAEIMSLDDICRDLGRSKGPISEAVRQLADWEVGAMGSGYMRHRNQT